MNTEHCTFNLKEAAAYLKMGTANPWRLIKDVRRGIVKGAKIAGKWVFLNDELDEYIRSKYPKPDNTTQADIHSGGKQCQSAKRREVLISIQGSRSAVSESMSLRRQIREETRKNMKKSESKR